MFKMFDVVKLATGEIATIVEIYKDGTFMVEVGDGDLRDIREDDIAQKIAAVDPE